MIPWWRLPAIGFAFAMAAAAVLWVYTRGEPASVAVKAARPVAPLPQSLDIDDLDAGELAAVRAAFEADETPPNDDELAVASPASAETLVENLDEDEVARLQAAL